MKKQTCHLASWVVVVFALAVAGFLRAPALLGADAGCNSTVSGVTWVEELGSSSPPFKIHIFNPPGGGVPLSVERRTSLSGSWVSVGNSQGTATEQTFTDATAVGGVFYEYQINNGSILMVAGKRIAPTFHRGKLLLVVDRSFLSDAGFLTALAGFEDDCVRDGWIPVRIPVDRGPLMAGNESAVDIQTNRKRVEDTKALIRAHHRSDGSGVAGIFLLGHVAFPYSGNLKEEHGLFMYGAKSADGYYGDLVNVWTDIYADSNLSSGAGLGFSNLPGDGKFDADNLPGSLTVPICRVDMADLPGAGIADVTSERAALIRYLTKLHDFKIRTAVYPDRMLTSSSGVLADDTAGWRIGGYFVERCSVYSTPCWGCTSGLNTPTALPADGYLLTYGSSQADGFAGINGIYTCYFGAPSTSCFNRPANLNAAFWSENASYSNYDDLKDHVVRAILAGPSGLASAAKWYELRYMALGKPINYAALARTESAGMASVHINGDPSLRTHYVAVPTSVALEGTATNFSLSWAPSTEEATDPNFLGYFVFWSDATNRPFQPVMAGTAPAFVAARTPRPARYSYGLSNNASPFFMVRSAKLQRTASGSYTNLSLGAYLSSPYAAPFAPIVANAPAAVRVSTSAAAGYRSASFAVTAYGRNRFSSSPPTAYAWYRVSSTGVRTLLSDDVRISGATTPTLLIRDVQAGDAGNYLVRITNDVGAAERTAALALNSPPALAGGGVMNVTVLEDQTVDFVLPVTDANGDFMRVGFNNSRPGDGGFPGDGQVLGSFAGMAGTIPKIRYTPPVGAHGVTTQRRFHLEDGEATSVRGLLKVTIQPSSRCANCLNQISPWFFQPINLGNPLVVSTNHNRDYGNGRWELSGIRHAELFTRAGDFTAQVNLERLISSRHAGLTVRENDSRDGRFVSIGLGELGQAVVTWRLRAGEPIRDYRQSLSGNTATRRLGLQRIGNTFLCFASADGVSWSAVGEAIAFDSVGSAMRLGLYTDAGDLAIGTATFNAFSVSTGAGAGFFPAVHLSAPVLTAGGFSFAVQGGAAGMKAVVETAQELTDWSVMQEMVLNGASQTFSDVEAVSHSHRFYRVSVGDIVSDNAVGFVRRTLPVGFATLGNSFGTGPNRLSQIFSNPPDGTVAYFFDSATGFTPSIYDASTSSWDVDRSIATGQSVVVENSSASPIVANLIGEIALTTSAGTLVSNRIEAVAPRFPMSGGLSRVGYANPVDRDVVYAYVNGVQVTYQYDGAQSRWTPSEPVFKHGEGVLLRPAQSRSWQPVNPSLGVRRLRLQAWSDPDTGPFAIRVFGGRAGGEVRLEASGDLQHWFELDRLVAGAGGSTYVDSGSPAAEKRFYRASIGCVPSANAVGFVRMALPTGAYWLVNPLDNFPNNLEVIVPSPTSDLQFGGSIYWGGELGWDPYGVLSPAVPLTGPATTSLQAPYSFSLVGEVPQGTRVSALGASAAYPFAGDSREGWITSDLGFPALAGDRVSMVTADQVMTYTLGANNAWSPSVPYVRAGVVAEISATTPRTWTRSLNVSWGDQLWLENPTRLASGQFQFVVRWAADLAPVTIEATADGTIWTPVATLTVIDGSAVFQETGNQPVRMYRAKSGVARSANAVGFARKTLGANNSLVSNPMFKGRNRIQDVLRSPPSGTTVYVMANGSLSGNAYDLFGDSTWDDPDQSIEPGLGFFLYNPLAVPMTVEFIGDVAQSIHAVTAIPANQSMLVASRVPRSDVVTRALGWIPTSGDRIDRFVNGAYVSYSYVNGTWTPAQPVLDVAEAVVIRSVQPARFDFTYDVFR